MPAKKPPKAEVSEQVIDGHSVRIVRGPDREELWIDGTRRRFFKNSGGYLLLENAYVPGQESLLDAVREYFRQARPAKPPKKSGGR